MAAAKMDKCFIKDRPEDVSWLCSLSTSEIDMLINLKLYVRHRAKMIGYEELAEKFDLKVLRAIAFILFEYFKEKVKDPSLTLDAVKPAALSSACNLLRCDHEGVICVEDLSKNIGVDPQHIVRGPQEEVCSAPEEVVSKRQKRKRKCFFVRKKRPKFKAENK
ncbi:uncharacterized protein LOC114727931 isoform X1 [Neltuma alba]|uniref:uncharacterized protein LOC114727931 isoform X1 n=1 Tax=Neltuma alba TaxID=207710 RepID=UPI0010A57EA2|nr:uncharacterized protein LOC114727931 isoform X1 [Prosopis alba]XP_028770551.1 uncharacterized protein LOC114727931 isoform X1 [Prosopis alba]